MTECSLLSADQRKEFGVKESAHCGISNTVHRLVGAAMARIAKRRPGRCRLVYDRQTRTIRKRGMHGEDMGDSGLHLHD